jgi:enoyl-CoA hydratase/carnithine racemase
MADYKNLLLERDGAIATVVLNRPEKRNALSLELLTELRGCLHEISADRATRMVILRANGQAFSAGHDLGEMVGCDGPFAQRLFEVCTEVMLGLRNLPQPVIAQVHAIATAAGCQLVASCDLVVASENARFATPGVKIGLFCSTPMVAVSRAIGAKKCMEMLLTGEPLSAREAQAAGLVNRVVAPDDLAKETRALADKILSSSSTIVSLGKRAFYRQLELSEPQAYDYAQEVMAANARAPDAQEGMRAFLEKRAPKWSDR